MLEPAVRAVRVAITLTDRFTELTKGPNTVSTTRNRGALLAVQGDDSTLSTRIGEAQQIYPEIWSHLDDARKAFAAQGVNVGMYDQVRAQPLSPIGANVDIRPAGLLGEDEVKTVHWNFQGIQQAAAAINALMNATPHIDWKGIAHAEANDPAVLAFNQSAKNARLFRTLLFVFIALVAVAALWKFAHPSHHH